MVTEEYFMRSGTSFLFLLLMWTVSSTAQITEERESAYMQTITERSQKIVQTLGIADTTVSRKVCEIIIEQYRNLNAIHTQKDNLLKSAANPDKSLEKELNEKAGNEAFARLYLLHFDYISKLMYYLDESQLEKVKDGMTYSILQVTYRGYCDMIPDLTGEQKKQIMVWLREARELAMDAGSAEEKHKWFGKYKGRINNYLTREGYDLKKEGEDWNKRIKENKN